MSANDQKRESKYGEDSDSAVRFTIVQSDLSTNLVLFKKTVVTNFFGKIPALFKDLL